MRAYNLEDGKRLVRVARKTIEGYISSAIFDRAELDKYAFGFEQKHGIFVTIANYPTFEVRGSMGFVLSDLPVSRLIVDAAISAAAFDPRYIKLSKLELEDIVIEICVLSKLTQVKEKNLELIKKEIEESEGFYLEYGFKKSILLPTSMAFGWSIEDKLRNLCTQAGLIQDFWKQKDVKIFKFEAQAFREIEPNKEIEEIKLGI
jgi:uncharacterized protein (TIGR00296 family)